MRVRVRVRLRVERDHECGMGHSWCKHTCQPCMPALVSQSASNLFEKQQLKKIVLQFPVILENSTLG